MGRCCRPRYHGSFVLVVIGTGQNSSGPAFFRQLSSASSQHFNGKANLTNLSMFLSVAGPGGVGAATMFVCVLILSFLFGFSSFFSRTRYSSPVLQQMTSYSVYDTITLTCLSDFSSLSLRMIFV